MSDSSQNPKSQEYDPVREEELIRAMPTNELRKQVAGAKTHIMDTMGRDELNRRLSKPPFFKDLWFWIAVLSWVTTVLAWIFPIR